MSYDSLALFFFDSGNHLYLLAQPEPPPSGWTSAGELLVSHAEKRPDVIFPLIAIVGLMAVIAGAGILLVRWVLPAWRDEKKADRLHLSELVAQRGKEALEDVAAGRELAKVQQAALVERIEGRVERVTGEIARISDRLDRHGETLRSVAAKVGAVVVALVLLGAAAAAAIAPAVLVLR